MPRLQKLIEKYKARTDVQFLTLNLDENPGLIDSFMKEHQLTFAVLPAFSFAYDTLKIFAIPQNWIIDSQGIIKLKGTGYDSTEKWDSGVAAAIDKIAASP